MECSPEMIDFLKKTLEPVPSKRLTIQQALDHPWISGSHHIKMTIPKSMVRDILKQLKESRTDCQLQKLFAYIIGNFIIHKDKRENFLRVFQYIDQQNKGYLNKKDFEEVFIKSEAKYQKEDLAIIFESLDTNKDGKVTYMDFCMGAVGKSDLYNNQHLKEVFRLMD